jgi:hypothetical protein
MTVRITFDSNAFDFVAADPDLKSTIKECQDLGLISIWGTHIQGGELAAIPDSRDIGQAQAVADINRTGTALFFCNFSHLGVDRLSSAESLAAFSAIQANNPKHTNDALIGATALVDTDMLVTDDGCLQSKFNQLAGVAKAISLAEFVTYLTDLLADAKSQ